MQAVQRRHRSQSAGAKGLPRLGSRLHERNHAEQATGVDESLDLNPVTFDLIAQLFLEDHCARNDAVDFSDAVEALYKRLRLEGKT
jgi:hypothetical protein